MKSKVIISLFETVRLSVSISRRNLYNSLKSIKEKEFITVRTPPNFQSFYDSLFASLVYDTGSAPDNKGKRDSLELLL